MENTLRKLRDATVDTVKDSLSASSREMQRELQEALERRVSSMLQTVTTASNMSSKFTGVNEDAILTFIPDDRELSGIGPMLLGIVALIILPGWVSYLSLLLFLSGIALFMLTYINNARVDVPDGYVGVVCRHGMPLDEYAKSGRNWYLDFRKFAQVLVSQRDQVVEVVVAGFTKDTASISLSMQIALRISNPSQFVRRTTPAGIMKIVQLYATYHGLRIVTSIIDSRIKFTGRDQLTNMVHTLNGALNVYGVEVLRVNMPSASNPVLNDLESVRTQLLKISTMTDEKQTQLEAAIKAEEASIRTASKRTQNEAFDLKQTEMRFTTDLAQQVDQTRQSCIIQARRQLDEKVAALRQGVAELRARIQKANALSDILSSLDMDFALRLAEVKRKAWQRLTPKQIQVLDIEGMGAGIGMSLGPQLTASFLSNQKTASEK